MAKFQIVSPHKGAECVLALEEMAAHNPDFLKRVWLGCHSGDHTGYAIIEAADESEARALIPPTLRKWARVVAVERETPEHIKSEHESAA